MKFVSAIATGGFILALPILLVTANVRILASDEGFYRRGLREHDAAEATGIALPELDRAAGEVVAYFENDANTLRILVHEGGQEESLFNARETEHMKDVKSLMRALYRLNEVALAYVLTYITAVFLWARERPLQALCRRALLGVGAGFTVLGVVGAFALSGFDQFWTRFHEIVFRNDLWRLDPDSDRLIQMFPEPFWEEATYIVGALTLVEAAAVVIVSVAYLLGTRQGPDLGAAPPRADARRLRARS
ncbi:MAG: TIGR01906 family membrane protein [Tepidiformaceae bacterium]